MKKTIAVFFGGTSPEYEISVLTGVQVFHALDTGEFDLIPVFVHTDGLFYTGSKLTDTKNYKDIPRLLTSCTQISFERWNDQVVMVTKKLFGQKKETIDCAFLAFHGAYGEGGAFQGFCEILGLPYTSSNVLGSSLAMDKVSMKKILSDKEIPTAKYTVLQEKDFIKNKDQSTIQVEKELSYPVFVKPSNGGSSIGVNRAKNREELIRALEVAFAFDSQVLVEEEFTKDSEVNISYLGLWNSDVKTSISEEVFSDNEFLDFENKYLKGSKSKKVSGSKGMASTNRNIPAQLAPELLSRITKNGEEAFRLLNCSGAVRIDFLVNKKTSEYVLVEVNSIPGSLAFYLWEKTNLPFDKLAKEMINLAFQKFENQKKKTRKFTSQVFKNL